MKFFYSICLLCFISFFSFISSARADDTEKKYPNIKPAGFVQFWWWYDETAGTSHGEDYEVARARIGAKGDLASWVDYLLLTEWGRLTFDDPCTLVDAYVNFRFDPIFNVKLGQTWYKFSLSGTQAIPAIPLIYRPEVVDGIWLTLGRNGSYGYDKGVEISGEAKKVALPFGYIFSVTTGTGVTRAEDNGKKDFTGRFYIEPKKDLKLGISGFSGYSRMYVSSNLGNNLHKDIPEYAWGADFSYSQKHFRFIYEYLSALYEGYLAEGAAETFYLATKKPRGWYALFGLKPLPWLEIPVQYAWYEKNSEIGDTGLKTITVGLTWCLKEGTLNNVKFNYIIRSADKNYGSKPRNLIALQAQFAF
jgi:hypothetical protein